MSADPYCPHCGAVNSSTADHCFACGRPLAEPEPASTGTVGAGRLLRQRYRLLRQIGAGGFGAVYRAEDSELGNRLVAIKEVNPRGLTPEEAREATENFRREALLLASLTHPNLPRIYEQFEEDGRWYLVMDFIEGETLEAYLAKQGGRLPVKEALQLGLQLTNVLGYLHNRQPPIIFRDLKPTNIMRAPDGQVYLIDFGIARLFKPGQSKDTMAFGSPGYAAPEQYGKAQTTPRSDIFSLGALLHQMLSGTDPSEKPFRFAPLPIMHPAGLATVIERMVQLDEERRPASMEIVRHALERLLSGQSTSSGDPLLPASAPARSTRTLSSASSAGAPPTFASSAPQAGARQSSLQPWASSASRPASGSGKTQGAIAVLGLLGIMLCIPVLIFATASHSSQPDYNTDPSTNNGYQPVYFATDTPGASVTSGVTATATPNTQPVSVYCVAWSPDGGKLASGGGDGTFQIWDAATDALIQNVRTDFEGVSALAWSPDGKYLATAGETSEIQIWNASDGSLLAAYQVSPRVISTLAWSSDNRSVALASGDGTVSIIDALNGSTSVIARTNAIVNAVAWSPDGASLAFGGRDQTVQVWSSASRQIQYQYQDSPNAIVGLAWSPDSKSIAVVDSASKVVIWNPQTGEHALSYAGDQYGINTIAWSPDGNYLAVGDTGDSVQVWLPTSTSPTYIYKQQTGTIEGIAWSPDSKRIASASIDGTVQIFDALTGANVVTWQQR